ncbi:tRNA lysidine(34) synthetase TilS [bacterium]|nr:tRNA lysidine(34) synthetase TilS [bacterium]
MLEPEINRFFSEHCLDRKAVYVCAVSGGVDSTALLATLCEVLGRQHVLPIYINHQLRPNSEIVEEISRLEAVCCSLNLPLKIRKIPVRAAMKRWSDGPEGTARRLRYRMLAHLTRLNRAAGIITGHHADDSAETILLKWVRGSRSGLSGILPISRLEGVSVIRPFYNCAKLDLIEFCRSRKLEYSDDSTNADIDIPRNRIRKVVLPELSKINPKVTESLRDMAAYVSELRKIVLDLSKQGAPVRRLPDSGVSIPNEKFDLSPTIICEMVHDILSDLHPPVMISREKIRRLIQLSTAQVGSRFPIDTNWTAFTEAGAISIRRIVQNPDFAYVIQLDQFPQEHPIPELGIRVRFEKSPVPDSYPETKSVAYLDPNVVGTSIIIRSRKAGDQFWPLGMPGPIRLNGFLSAQRVPAYLRWQLPLFFAGDDLVWVGNFRISHSARIKNAMDSALRISIYASN